MLLGHLMEMGLLGTGAEGGPRIKALGLSLWCPCVGLIRNVARECHERCDACRNAWVCISLPACQGAAGASSKCCVNITG